MSVTDYLELTALDAFERLAPLRISVAGEKSAASDKVYIDEANSLISREIFVHEGIHRIEIDRIFSKVWLFFGHESEIPTRAI